MSEELFESIIYEWRQPGGTAWTDFSEDVLQNPVPHGTRGMMSNRILDRVEADTYFQFSLDNTAANSQGSAGYYTGNRMGYEVRLGFTYDGRTRYKWHGYVKPGGWSVSLGKTLTNTGVSHIMSRVDVTCQGWFGLMGETQLNSLAYTTNQSIDTATPLLVSNIDSAIQPAYTDYRAGEYNFPAVFDLTKSETTILGEFNKLAISEMGWIFSQGNEQDGLTLCAWGRLQYPSTNTVGYKTSSETTDLFLLPDGSSHFLLPDGSSRLLLSEGQTFSFTEADLTTSQGEVIISQGDDYANIFKGQITPRVLDAAATTILWTLEGSVQVPSNTTIGPFRAQYHDPNNGPARVNCIEGTAPEATTDYQAFANADGTGTNFTSNMVVTVTFDTADAEYYIENTGGTAFYTGKDILFQLRGKGVYIYDTVDVIFEPSANAQLGRRVMVFPMVYFDDVVEARRMLRLSVMKVVPNATAKISSFPLLANRDKKNMMAFMTLEPFTRASFIIGAPFNYPPQSDIHPDSFIFGYEFKIVENKKVYWSPCLYPEYDIPIS